jgi:hypothetical protein
MLTLPTIHLKIQSASPKIKTRFHPQIVCQVGAAFLSPYHKGASSLIVFLQHIARKHKIIAKIG